MDIYWYNVKLNNNSRWSKNMKINFCEWLGNNCAGFIEKDGAIHPLSAEDVILDEYFSRIELRDQFYDILLKVMALEPNSTREFINQVVRNISSILQIRVYNYKPDNEGTITLSFSEQATRDFNDLQKLTFATTPQAKIYHDAFVKSLMEGLLQCSSNSSTARNDFSTGTSKIPMTAPLDNKKGTSSHLSTVGKFAQSGQTAKREKESLGSGFKKGFLKNGLF